MTESTSRVASDDPELVWNVTACESETEASVRHPRLDVVGWAIAPNEHVAREKALLRLNSMLRDQGGTARTTEDLRAATLLRGGSSLSCRNSVLCV